MLPNNLAEWPSAAGGQSRVRPGGKDIRALDCLGFVLLGGLIVIAVYHWVMPDVGTNVNLPKTVVAQPLARVILPPDSDDPANADRTLIPEAARPTPEINVSALLGNHAESQDRAGYAATGGAYTGVSAAWTIPDVAFISSPGVDAATIRFSLTPPRSRTGNTSPLSRPGRAPSP